MLSLNILCDKFLLFELNSFNLFSLSVQIKLQLITLQPTYSENEIVLCLFQSFEREEEK